MKEDSSSGKVSRTETKVKQFHYMTLWKIYLIRIPSKCFVVSCCQNVFFVVLTCLHIFATYGITAAVETSPADKFFTIQSTSRRQLFPYVLV